MKALKLQSFTVEAQLAVREGDGFCVKIDFHAQIHLELLVFQELLVFELETSAF